MNHQAKWYKGLLFHGCCGRSNAKWRFLLGCNQNIRDPEIATKLFRVVMNMLADTPPSVPPRGEPMVSVFTSGERKLKWERARLRAIRKRHRDTMDRISDQIERRNWRYGDGGDSEESFEEEHIA